MNNWENIYVSVHISASILTKSSVNSWLNIYIFSGVIIIFTYILHFVRMNKMEYLRYMYRITFIKIIMKYTLVPQFCVNNINKPFPKRIIRRLVYYWFTISTELTLIWRGKNRSSPFWSLNGPYLLNLESPSPKDDFCQVWLNGSGSGEDF